MKVSIKLAPDTQVKKLLSLSPEEMQKMDESLRMSSMVWVGLVDGKLACVWGIVPPSFLSNQAYLWLKSTDLIKEHSFIFVRHSQKVIQDLLEQYEVILGHCVIGTPFNMKWLKWLGAEFSDPEGRLIPFRIRKKQHG